jgi:tetratricopeptide (TPR) repeat protein
LVAFYLLRLELHRAYRLAQQLVALAEQGGDADSLLKGYTLSGISLCITGEHCLASRHLERAESLHSHAKPSLYGPFSFCVEATTLGCMGYADQALDHCRRGLALAGERPDPHTRVAALNQAAIFHVQRREGERSLELADEMLRVSTEYGFQQLFAIAMLNRGWALIELDRAEEGVAQLRQARSKDPAYWGTRFTPRR